MRRYDAYKDSGIEWIGEIPSHWNTKKLKYVASINDDVLSERTEEEFEIEYVDISSIESNVGITKSETFTFKDAPSRARRLVNDGDIIVSTVRTYLKAIAKIEEPKPNLVVSTGFAVVRPKIVKSNYAGHLFYHENLLGEIISRSVGVSYPAINSTEIGNIPIPLPPTAEQTAIAAYLDRKTAEIDELIADKKSLLQLYEEEKTAIINQLVTGKKVWNGYAWTEPVEVKDSGIECLPAEASAQAGLGEIPEHWEVKKIKHLLIKKKGALKTGPFGSQLKTSDLVSNGKYKVFTQRNVLDNDFEKGEDRIDEDKFLTLKEFLVEEGDILFTSRGTIGKCNVIPSNADSGILHPCLIRIQIDRELVCEEWILNYANKSSYFTDNVKYESNSTIIDVIYGGTLKEILLPIPPLEEQHLIARRIETECTRIDCKKLKTEKLIELLTEYRMALISEVVTGKVKVI